MGRATATWPLAAALADLGIVIGGESVRLPDSIRQVPVVRYGGVTTPISRLSSGILRVISVMYLTAWTLREHRVAAHQRGVTPSDRMLLLLDEPENHLHIDMQRQLPGALRSLARALLPGGGIQWVAATHSPVFLSSALDQDSPIDRDIEMGKDTKPGGSDG